MSANTQMPTQSGRGLSLELPFGRHGAHRRLIGRQVERSGNSPGAVGFDLAHARSFLYCTAHACGTASSQVARTRASKSRVPLAISARAIGQSERSVSFLS